ncbi:polymerase [Vibrio sp. 10N.286.49.C2]|uniref:DUF342 domain-containing protein n=1 Tax=unclassified Vibrio TaxID=2614977 RepID=UPI000C822D3D|nr:MULTISPECIES: FapA family protein [unclassified Vibrio]PMH36695.1 polymerase [Vibrio sp. 10N.286.49.C2]PMH54683.1 polymerase [Vibrio sp. 10N.286.49.B1]PMH78321.1 polymerase [Vibrio sp. 10N.286.48.B7]
MWKSVLQQTSDKNSVVAMLPQEYEQGLSLEKLLLENALSDMEAKHLFLDDSAVNQFISCAQLAKKEAFQGIKIAYTKDASVSVSLCEQDMIARMTVEGAYGGLPLTGAEVIKTLADSQVIKGINKLALKKVLLLSRQLEPGKSYVQPVAVGKRPIEGRNSEFIALIDDPKARVLKPQIRGESDKVDMRDLGQMVTVGVGEKIMKRIPAISGQNGYTVTGAIIPPKAVNDTPLKPGKGTKLSPEDPNILISDISGMPIIKTSGIDVDEALCLAKVDISTGHIRFEGSVVVSGNVEAQMEISATGSITVGGFVESAKLDAKGDVIIAKGIIGHNVDDGESKTCLIQSGGDIVANYAQFANLTADEDIKLAVHSLNNDMRCAGDLIVQSANRKQGTLSGGLADVGGKVVCNHLGVEGDTATYINAFSNHKKYISKLEQLQDDYTALQEHKMMAIRREIELKKIPKSARSDDENQELDALNSTNTESIDKLNEKKAAIEEELFAKLETSTVESLVQTHTRVTVSIGGEKVTTKNTHGPAVFQLKNNVLNFVPKLKEEDVAV